jgi:selenocysteine-specific elongation factor
VAVNLSGLGRDQIARGDVLTSAASELRETYVVDVELAFAAGINEPESGARVQIHHGTRETAARISWLGGRFWQIRAEQPLIPSTGDRVVLRQVAPPDTLGGGRVLDAHPRKHGPSRDLLAQLTRLARGEATAPVAAEPEREPAPIRPQPVLHPSALELEQRLRQAGFEPPPDAELDGRDLAALREAGRAIRVSRTMHLHPDALAAGRRLVIELAERHGGAITIAQLRDELGSSRKFAQALLEHLDGERVTIRRGDQHVVRRRHRPGR